MPPSKRAESDRALCQYCGQEFAARGVRSHERSCAVRSTEVSGSILNVQQQALAFIAHRRGDWASNLTKSSLDPQADYAYLLAQAALNAAAGLIDTPINAAPTGTGTDFDVEDPPPPQMEAGEDAGGLDDDGEVQSSDLNYVPEQDDIKILYHPAARQAPQIFDFLEYCREDPQPGAGGPDPNSAPPTNPPQPETEEPEKEIPWRPFLSRVDYELAEVILDSHMNKRQVDSLLGTIQKIILDPGSFTLASHTQLTKIWDLTRDTRAVGFTKTTIHLDYNDEQMEYDVWARPIWRWCKQLLTDPKLISEFRWDAEKLFRFNGDIFECFIDEPWTADDWWDFQNTIPSTSKPLCLIFYADKTRLSSFGTEKGYPAVVRCANLPASIRNGEGCGGGCLAGWLPIPEEVSEESGKKAFKNLKRSVWHESVYEILKSIEKLAELGTAIACGDGVVRQIIPHILIMSADYEEQTMMALTRGSNALFPCPTCLVPKAEIPNLAITHRQCTSTEMQEIWERGQALNAREREELLKSYGLQDVENIFWRLRGTDVYKALSWDRLHAYHGGLFSDHLLELLKTILKELPGSRDLELQIDTSLRAIPPWAGLNHFSSLGATGEFADGTKFEDLSKVIIFASQHVFTEGVTPEGFCLLKLIRSYLELDMYAGLTVHTEATLAAGHEELMIYSEILKEFMEKYPLKSWTFPKNHTHQHLFTDILRKGVTRNYNTKPNEKSHGSLKKFYQQHTNFKNVASQIIRVNEMDVVSTIIRDEIDAVDHEEERKSKEISMAVELGGEVPVSRSTDIPPIPEILSALDPGAQRIFLSSVRPQIELQELERSSDAGGAFLQFRKKLNEHLTYRLQVRVTLSAAHLITPYLSLKVRYSSVIDWRVNQDILRANPMFHNRPRYDHALISVDGNKCIFVQILYIFTVIEASKAQKHSLALVLPLDVPRSTRNRGRDVALRLQRVQARTKTSSVIIDVNSIVRGALLAEDGDPNPNAPGKEFYVIDMVDEDMWRRLRSIELVQRVHI